MIARLSTERKPDVRTCAFRHGSILGMKDRLTLSTMGARLRYAREKAHLTQEAVAEQVGRTHGAVGQWERDETTPELGVFIEAAELYGASLDWLVWGGDDMASGIEGRIRKVHHVLRAALVQRLHKEIDSTEEAAKRLPAEMLSESVKDRDPRLSGWAVSKKPKGRPSS